MPIDSSIAMGVQPMKIDSPMNALAQILQVQNAQQANQLGSMTMQHKQQEYDDINKLNSFYTGALGADGKIDRAKLYQNVASGGLGSKLPSLQKGFLDSDEAQGKVDAQKFKLASDRHAIYQKSLGALAQEPSLNKEMVMQAGQGLVQQGILSAEMFQQSVANLPDDPAQLRARLTQGMKAQLTPEQIFTVFAPKPEKMDNGGQISFMDTNPNSLTYGKPTGGAPVQKVQSPESVASVAATVRGQNMTDERAREFNDTKVEENKIKRDAKDETTNLTKSSQLASFDTMLGTLDRLGKHNGLSASVGISGAFPTMPGSQSANFQAELHSFQSQAFIPMVAQLKGMGALSDSEGKKLTAAVGALDPKMGEVAFRESVARITIDMQAARARMAGGAQSAATSSGATGSWGDAQAPAAPISIKNAADYANIPSGATYIDPKGQMRKKP